MILAVKYCGGCNPVIDRVQVVRELSELLNKSVKISYKLDEAYDLLLLVDGCNVGCTARDVSEQQRAKCLFVAGEAFMDKQVPEQQLATVIADAINKYSSQPSV